MSRLRSLLFTIGFVVTTNALSAGTPTVLSSPSVFDANGALVGHVASYNALTSDALVLMTYNGHSFVVEMNRDGFADDLAVWFESSDCSGTPYMIANTGPRQPSPWQHALIAPGVVLGALQTAFIPFGDKTTDAIAANSYLDGSGCNVRSATGVPFVMSARVGSFRGQFTPPFSIHD